MNITKGIMIILICLLLSFAAFTQVFETFPSLSSFVYFFIAFIFFHDAWQNYIVFKNYVVSQKISGRPIKVQPIKARFSVEELEKSKNDVYSFLSQSQTEENIKAEIESIKKAYSINPYYLASSFSYLIQRSFTEGNETAINNLKKILSLLNSSDIVVNSLELLLHEKHIIKGKDDENNSIS